MILVSAATKKKKNKVVLRVGLRVGDRVEVSYPVDDFPGHVGIVREVKESTEFPGKTVVICYWPFLDKEIAFFEEDLDLV
jgi:hypothetical protein